MPMSIASPKFRHGEEIPPEYTSDGRDVSPPLEWFGVPKGTESFALIVDDPDAPDPAAPKRVFTHWVVYNLPPELGSLPENASPLPSGALGGKNDFGNIGFGGPSPPIGRHRYFFKLYALDTVLPDLRSPTKAELLKAMEGHILEKAELIGTYKTKLVKEKAA